MKKLVFVLILIFFFPFGKAWRVTAQNIDSLKNVWQDKTLPDTTRLKAIHKITWDGYLYSQPDSAFHFAQQQYDLAKSKGLKKQMAEALNTQGVSFYLQGNYPWALEYYQKSLVIREEIGNKGGIAISLNNIGNIYRVQGNYPQALEYQQKSLAMYEEIGDKGGIANSLTNIGFIYNNQGNYSRVLEYQQKSLAIYEEIGDKRGIAGSLNNIGLIYRNQGNNPGALEYQQKSLAIFEEIEDKRGIAISLINIGGIYSGQGNYPRALEYNQKSLAIQEEIGDKKGIASNLNNIGAIYRDQGNYHAALDYCQKGYDMALSIGVLEEQKDACKCLYNSYKAQGKGNEALVYLEKMRVVEDSLHAQETTKKLEQMEFAKVMLQDSIAKAEESRLIEEAHKEEVRKNKQTRNYLAGAGILFLLLSGGFYSRWRFVRKSRDIISKERDRSENLLLNILPADIAAELKEKGRAEARDFEMVSILFTDFKDFTEQSEKLSAAELVNEINVCFEAFDAIMEKHGIEKIKTIGDAYMAAGGLPVPTDDSVKNTVKAAIEIQEFIQKRKVENTTLGKPAFEMRVGIHTGPVVAGIVGVKKFQYDIWGDTVNTASRMESAGEVGKVNISQTTYELLKDDSQFTFESRGKIKAKGKGVMDMYFAIIKNQPLTN